MIQRMKKIVLLISHTLQKEELLWLELLALYVSMFMDSLKLIEDLVLDIQHMKVTNETQLPWLDKLLWNIIEKEKSILAQELHDTILQEQLHLARELDVLAGSSTIQGEKVRAIREQLLNATKDLREYCENLSPPLLDTFGLQIALKKTCTKGKYSGKLFTEYTDRTCPFSRFIITLSRLSSCSRTTQ